MATNRDDGEGIKMSMIAGDGYWFLVVRYC